MRTESTSRIIARKLRIKISPGFMSETRRKSVQYFIVVGEREREETKKRENYIFRKK